MILIGEILLYLEVGYFSRGKTAMQLGEKKVCNKTKCFSNEQRLRQTVVSLTLIEVKTPSSSAKELKNLAKLGSSFQAHISTVITS